MMMMLTGISTVHLVEALQLCLLSLSESTRQRVSSFLSFLSRVVNNQHIIVHCGRTLRQHVSPILIQYSVVVAVVMIIHFISIHQVVAVFTEQEKIKRFQSTTSDILKYLIHIHKIFDFNIHRSQHRSKMK